MTLGTQVIVHHHLAVEARPNNWAHLTVITCHTHVHLLAICILLDIGVFKAPCRQKMDSKVFFLLLILQLQKGGWGNFGAKGALVSQHMQIERISNYQVSWKTQGTYCARKIAQRNSVKFQKIDDNFMQFVCINRAQDSIFDDV